MSERKQTLTVYLQVGEKHNTWTNPPRLIKATSRADADTHPETVSTIRLDLVLPESVYRKVKPQQTIRVEIDPEKVALVEVTQEEL